MYNPNVLKLTRCRSGSRFYAGGKEGGTGIHPPEENPWGQKSYFFIFRKVLIVKGYVYLCSDR